MRDDLILWLDLETTGVDENADPIIEVGALFTDNTPEFAEIDNFSVVVRPPSPMAALDRMDVDVTDMHLANGLIRAILLREGEWLATADTSIDIWIGNITQSNKKVPLAGSGVSHFDRRFIKAQMPKLDKRLTFWAYDVGAVRRFLRLYGLTDETAQHEAKTHRALDDVRAHVAEARYYATLLRDHKQAFDAASTDEIARSA